MKSFEERCLGSLRLISKDPSAPKEFRAAVRNVLKYLEYLKRVCPDIYHEAVRTPTLDDPDPLARKILRRLHNLRRSKARNPIIARQQHHEPENKQLAIGRVISTYGRSGTMEVNTARLGSRASHRTALLD